MTLLSSRVLTRGAAAAAALTMLSLAAAGCGSGSQRTSPGSPAGAVATNPAAAKPLATNVASPQNPTPTGANPSASVSASLAAVESDEQAVGAATDQSDTDFNAAVSDEAQNDDP